MFYTIYKITNKINNKFYIGMHKTNNLDDGYMGSGKLICAAIKKYGMESFSKDILFVFDNEEGMRSKEKELVVLSENSYNLCEGGKGGFGYLNRTGKNKSNAQKKIASILMKNIRDKMTKEDLIKAGSKGHKEMIKHFPNGVWFGKTHSKESKEKIGLTNSKKQQGNKNSQYGTCWITDGTNNKKIKIIDLDSYFAQGYYRGRVF